MASPSGFDIGRQVGMNFAQTRKDARDEGAIDQILSSAMKSGDPDMLQNSIGQILSQVSPERQGTAIQYLQNTIQQIQKRSDQSKLEQKERQASQDAGYTYGAPPQVAAQQLKDKSKNQRLSQYGLGNQMSIPSMQIDDIQESEFIQQPEIQNTQNAQPSSVLEKMSDQQLMLLTGHPDREISEPSKAILKGRDEQRSISQKEQENWTKFGMERAKKVLDRSEEVAQGLPVKKTALKMMVDSIANKNLSFFSKDNLAEITGIEGLRSPEGAIFKTSGKEYFLGSISRAGARPNQWIEQQISDMMTKIGRSTEANLSVARALKNETEIEEERVKLTDETFDELRKSKKDIGDLGSIVNKKLSNFAEEKQKELFNDLRAIEAIADDKNHKKDRFKKVQSGTKISPYMVDSLLKSFDNDPQKALQEAKKLGYSIE